MNTLILNGTEKDLKLLLDISKKIGIDLKVVKEKTALASPQTKKMTAKEKEKLITDLSKSTNKAITKRMFAHFKMTYPE